MKLFYDSIPLFWCYMQLLVQLLAEKYITRLFNNVESCNILKRIIGTDTLQHVATYQKHSSKCCIIGQKCMYENEFCTCTILLLSWNNRFKVMEFLCIILWRFFIIPYINGIFNNRWYRTLNFFWNLSHFHLLPTYCQYVINMSKG